MKVFEPSGWIIQDHVNQNMGASLEVESHWERSRDYPLFIDITAVGVVEA